MSTLTDNQISHDPRYPTLLRRGHRYEFCLGQRVPVGGFYGPLDVSIGDDGWFYVLNRWEQFQNVPRNRYVPVTIDDEYGEFIFPTIDGKPEIQGKEKFPSPVMCTIDNEGVLYSTDEHANVVLMLSTSGETIGWWGEFGSQEGQLNGPSGITLDSDQNLWVVNCNNHKIQKFTRDGQFIDSWGDFGTELNQLNHPWGITIDPIDNSLLIADWRNDLVKRFSTEGDLLQVIGSPGNGIGELDRPSSVAVDQHGDIYIVDRGNN